MYRLSSIAERHNLVISTVFNTWLVDLKSRNVASVGVVSQNVHETLVSHFLLYVVFLYPLYLGLRLIPTRQAVHFGPETDEFERRGGAGLALHFAQNSMILSGVQGVVGVEIARVEQIHCFAHVPVEIGCLDVAAQRVGVRE